VYCTFWQLAEIKKSGFFNTVFQLKIAKNRFSRYASHVLKNMLATC